MPNILIIGIQPMRKAGDSLSNSTSQIDLSASEQPLLRMITPFRVVISEDQPSLDIDEPFLNFTIKIKALTAPVNNRANKESYPQYSYEGITEFFEDPSSSDSEQEFLEVKVHQTQKQQKLDLIQQKRQLKKQQTALHLNGEAGNKLLGQNLNVVDLSLIDQMEELALGNKLSPQRKEKNTNPSHIALSVGKEKNDEKEHSKTKEKKKRKKVKSQLEANIDKFIEQKAPEYPVITFRRNRELQDILIAHNFKNKIFPLMREIARIGLYSTVLEDQKTPLPNVPEIPLDFYSQQYYQQIFLRNLKNQILHTIRSKLTHFTLRYLVSVVSFSKRSDQLFQVKIKASPSIFQKLKQSWSKSKLMMLVPADPRRNPKNKRYPSFFWQNSFKQPKEADFALLPSFTILCGEQILSESPYQCHLFDLDKLSTQCREYDAVVNLKAHKLQQFLLDPCRFIKKPCLLKYTRYLDMERLLEIQVKKKFNESQFRAIQGIAYQDSGISLLQGPPGTGKTSTLLGVLACELAKLEYFSSKALNLNLKILVCAPSNSAVDHIGEKIITEGIQSLDGIIQPTLLRVGVAQQSILKGMNLTYLIQWLSNLGSQAGNSLTWEDLTYARQDLQKRLLSFNGIKKGSGSSPNYLAENQDEGSAGKIQWCRINKKMHQSDPQDQKQSIQDLPIEPVSQLLKAQLNTKIKILKKLLEKYPRRRDSPNQRIPMKDSICFIQKQLFQDAQIIITTLASSFSQKVTSFNPTFSCLIVDEAAQATEPNLLIPFQFGMNKIVLIGDPCQLPPTVLYEGCIKNKLNRSLFERLIESGSRPYFLDTQYRMAPLICDFPNITFYNKRLRTAESRLAMPKPAWIIGREAIFIDCWPQKQMRIENSYANQAEAYIVSQLIKRLVTLIGQSKGRPMNIGIITPYSAQQNLIKNKISSLCQSSQIAFGPNADSSFLLAAGGNKFGPKKMISVTVSTVDSYQGQERDVIIISNVRSNPQNKVGFIGDRKRVNVCLTRAKRMVIVIGNEETLSANPVWNSYIQWARENRCYIKVSNGEVDQLLEKLFAKPVEPAWLMQ